MMFCSVAICSMAQTVVRVKAKRFSVFRFTSDPGKSCKLQTRYFSGPNLKPAHIPASQASYNCAFHSPCAPGLCESGHMEAVAGKSAKVQDSMPGHKN